MRKRRDQMAKEDLLPFKYDSKTNTVFNTSGAKIVPVERRKLQSKSWLHTFFYLAARLAAWYVLYMIFWGCPPNARLDPSAPPVCRRFDILKHNTIPHIKPCYDNYAEPYLARAQPYLQKGQGYYEQFGAPTVAKGQDLWVKQATPRIKKSYSTLQDHYNNKIYPVLDRTVLKKAREVYSKYLDTHVRKVSSQYTKFVHPHLQSLQKRSYKLYCERLVPAYQATAPRVHHAFLTVENKYTALVEPRVHAVIKWVIRKTEQVIIPRVTVLWAKHVQPQLDRIYDKLFRNRESKQAASMITGEGETTQTFLSSPVSSQYTEAYSTPVSSYVDVEDEEDIEIILLEEEPEPEPEPTVVHERPPLNRPVQVDALLEKWRAQIRATGVETEELFLGAIQEIFETEKERETSMTKNMVLELNNTVQSEIASLENTIIYLARKGPASGQDDPRLKELNKNVVASGKNIRNHAVEIRNYLKTIKGRFEGKIIERRKMAWEIMDEVVGEGQAEIGNLWMWLADITYYDWQEYHGLADMTKTIKQRIHASGAGEHFTTMAEIQEAAEKEINIISKDAANKLAKLKEIGRERILMGDDSENFGSGWVPAGIKMAAEDVESKVSKVVDQILEGVGKATDAVESAADTAVPKISESIYETPQGIVESVVSLPSKAVVGEEPPKIVSSAQDVLGSPGDVATDAASKVSSAVFGTSQGAGESIASEISNTILDTTPGVTDSVASQVTSIVGEAYNSAASYTSEIIDDLPSVTDVVDGEKVAEFSVSSLADDAFSSASNVASSAASIAGEGIINPQDRAQKVFKVPKAGVGEKIASKASEVVYGTGPGVAEKATDVADTIGSKVSEVVTGAESDVAEKATDAGVSVGEKIASKASEVVYGIEPDVAEKATDTAIIVGENAVSKASEEIYGTEPDVMEKAASIASSVVSEASEVIVETEPGTIEKATSAAESVVDKATLKVADLGEEVSNIASEITEAIGAATSNVWENKPAQGGYRDEL